MQFCEFCCDFWKASTRFGEIYSIRRTGCRIHEGENLLPEIFLYNSRNLSQQDSSGYWFPSFWKSWRWVCIIASDKINDSPFRWRFWIRPDPFFVNMWCILWRKNKLYCSTTTMRAKNYTFLPLTDSQKTRLVVSYDMSFLLFGLHFDLIRSKLS